MHRRNRGIAFLAAGITTAVLLTSLTAQTGIPVMGASKEECVKPGHCLSESDKTNRDTLTATCPGSAGKPDDRVPDPDPEHGCFTQTADSGFLPGSPVISGCLDDRIPLPGHDREKPDAQESLSAVRIGGFLTGVSGSGVFESLTDGEVLPSGCLSFRVCFALPDGVSLSEPFALTLDGHLLDDVRVTDAVPDGGGYAEVLLELSGGTHTLTASAQDSGGGQDRKTVVFSVPDDGHYPLFAFSLPDGKPAFEGETLRLELTGAHLENLRRMTARLTVHPAFSFLDVILADDVAGMYAYHGQELIMDFEPRNGVLLPDMVLATVLLQGSPTAESFGFEVLDGAFELADESALPAHFHGGFSSPSCHFSPVGETDGQPYALIQTAVSPVLAGMHGRFGAKDITWMSHPFLSEPHAFVQLSRSEDMADATIFTGSSRLTVYGESGDINRLNRVRIDGLKEDTSYYFRVGDGQTWSDIRTFRTPADDGNADFFITGGTSGPDYGRLHVMAGASGLAAGDFDYGVQLGNVLDHPGRYDACLSLLTAFSGEFFGDLPMIHLTGEREHSAGSEGQGLYERLFAVPEDGFFSMEYQHVYAAFIGDADPEKQQDALNRMVQEANDSTCSWRVLFIHTPLYASDAEGNRNEAGYAIQAAAEKAGMDAVFCTGGSGYARTEPLRNGQIDPDHGVVYFLCGDGSGTPDPVVADSHPDFSVVMHTTDAVYLTLHVDGERLTVRAVSVAENGTSTVTDVYDRFFVCREGEHRYEVDEASGGQLRCSLCGQYNRDEWFRGLIYIDGVPYCMDGPNPVFGWIHLHGHDFYFAPQFYFAVNGRQTIQGYTYEFTDYHLTDGQWIEENGRKKLMWAGHLARNRWVVAGGKQYYFGDDQFAVTGICRLPDPDTGKLWYYRFDGEGVLMERIGTENPENTSDLSAVRDDPCDPTPENEKDVP